MKKVELLARIEMLERRLAAVEARPVYVPPFNPAPFHWPNYPSMLTTGVVEPGQACTGFAHDPFGVGAASAR